MFEPAAAAPAPASRSAKASAVNNRAFGRVSVGSIMAPASRLLGPSSSFVSQLVTRRDTGYGCEEGCRSVGGHDSGPRSDVVSCVGGTAPSARFRSAARLFSSAGVGK